MYVITDMQTADVEYFDNVVDALRRLAWLNNAHRKTFRFDLSVA
jgi:hypothetical protein